MTNLLRVRYGFKKRCALSTGNINLDFILVCLPGASCTVSVLSTIDRYLM